MGRPDAKKAGGSEPSHKETEALLGYRDWLLRAFGFRFERFLPVFSVFKELAAAVRFFASLSFHWLEPSVFLSLAIDSSFRYHTCDLPIVHRSGRVPVAGLA